MRSVDFKGFSQYDQRDLFEVRFDTLREAATFEGNFNLNRGSYMLSVEANRDKYNECLVKVVFSSDMSKEQVKIGIRNALSMM
ncbi:hypothetical protein [Bacillus cereus]|uniref:hypothetical protein n=1 Tax=Bacillus cereus TaxID=1396 RepID=UPI001F0E95CC|nr:hypothetical protein [Bacillus cereus]MCH5460852.1 hypothetical protein [Bacillus cereus]